MTKYFLSKLLCILIAFLAITQNAYSKQNIEALIEKIEHNTEGRMGLYALNTHNKEIIAYREEELFPTQSTYKVLGAAAILSKIENTPNKLKQKIYFTTEDLITTDFLSGSKIEDGMTINELCHSAITTSDSGAMNIIIREIGGKEKLNNFTKSLGNNILSSDNGWNKKLYSKDQNDTFTSTPKQMITSLKKIVLDNVLNRPFRDLITSYLIDSKTGENRIKAGTPNNWLVGNKTGSGSTNGTTNDIAIIWPPKHKPILIGVFYNSNKNDTQLREDVLAETTSIIINEFKKNDNKLQ